MNGQGGGNMLLYIMATNGMCLFDLNESGWLAPFNGVSIYCKNGFEGMAPNYEEAPLSIVCDDMPCIALRSRYVFVLGRLPTQCVKEGGVLMALPRGEHHSYLNYNLTVVDHTKIYWGFRSPAQIMAMLKKLGVIPIRPGRHLLPCNRTLMFLLTPEPVILRGQRFGSWPCAVKGNTAVFTIRKAGIYSVLLDNKEVQTLHVSSLNLPANFTVRIDTSPGIHLLKLRGNKTYASCLFHVPRLEVTTVSVSGPIYRLRVLTDGQPYTGRIFIPELNRTLRVENGTVSVFSLKKGFRVCAAGQCVRVSEKFGLDINLLIIFGLLLAIVLGFILFARTQSERLFLEATLPSQRRRPMSLKEFADIVKNWMEQKGVEAFRAEELADEMGWSPYSVEKMLLRAGFKPYRGFWALSDTKKKALCRLKERAEMMLGKQVLVFADEEEKHRWIQKHKALEGVAKYALMTEEELFYFI